MFHQTITRSRRFVRNCTSVLLQMLMLTFPGINDVRQSGQAVNGVSSAPPSCQEHSASSSSDGDGDGDCDDRPVAWSDEFLERLFRVFSNKQMKLRDRETIG